MEWKKSKDAHPTQKGWYIVKIDGERNTLSYNIHNNFWCDMSGKTYKANDSSIQWLDDYSVDVASSEEPTKKLRYFSVPYQGYYRGKLNGHGILHFKEDKYPICEEIISVIIKTSDIKIDSVQLLQVPTELSKEDYLNFVDVYDPTKKDENPIVTKFNQYREAIKAEFDICMELTELINTKCEGFEIETLDGVNYIISNIRGGWDTMDTDKFLELLVEHGTITKDMFLEHCDEDEPK